MGSTKVLIGDDATQLTFASFAGFLLLGIPNVLAALLLTPNYVGEMNLTTPVHFVVLVSFLIALVMPTINYCSTGITEQRFSTMMPMVTAVVCSIISSAYAILLISRIGLDEFGIGHNPMVLTAQTLVICLTVVGAASSASMMRTAYLDTHDQ